LCISKTSKIVKNCPIPAKCNKNIVNRISLRILHAVLEWSIPGLDAWDSITLDNIYFLRP
jgi:hypothetical protein